MKLDMHCHTKEGSIDGRVNIEEYIHLLKEKGFQGMLVTDHNSYNGYRYWKSEISGRKELDFVVLKGIEYDTSNAGHMIVVMPEGVKPRVLEVRGMPVNLLISVVHAYGGIVGPAHPCGEKYMSFGGTKAFRKNRVQLMKKFDFVETFNACESKDSNKAAAELAREFFLPGIGGSDSHREACVGTAYTQLSDPVSCESDFIQLIKKKAPMKSGGEYYHGTTKEKIGKMNNLLVYSFWVYNKTAGLMKMRKRRAKTKLLNFNQENPSTHRI